MVLLLSALGVLSILLFIDGVEIRNLTVGNSLEFDDILSLKCVVKKILLTEITWSRDSVFLSSKNDSRIQISPFMNDMSILTISRANPDDSGDYTCIAATQIGSVNQTITIAANATAVDGTPVVTVVTALRNGCQDRFKGVGFMLVFLFLVYLIALSVAITLLMLASDSAVNCQLMHDHTLIGWTIASQNNVCTFNPGCHYKYDGYSVTVICIMFLDIGLVVGVAFSVGASPILAIVAIIIIAAVRGKAQC